MKTAFKVMSVLMIIASAVMAIIGVVVMFFTDKLFVTASGATTDLGGTLLGIGWMIFFFVGATLITTTVIMLLTGINGLRGYTEKCRQYAVFLIAAAVAYLLMSIMLRLNKVLPVSMLIFFGIYFFVAKQADEMR